MSFKPNSVRDSRRFQNKQIRVNGNDNKCNPQAEKILISGLIKDSLLFYDFSQYLSQEDFTVVEYQKTFFVLSKYYNDLNDTVSLINFEAKSNELGFVDLINNQSVSDLFNLNVTTDEVKRAFTQVKRESIRRAYEDSFFEVSDYIEHTTDNVNIIVSTVEEKVIGISDRVRHSDFEIKNLASDAENILMTLANNPGRHGIDMGFPLWQNAVGELSCGTVHMIVADTKVGKSQLGLRSALNVAMKYNIPTLYCDSEMSREQHTIRLLGMYLKIPYWIIKSGFWNLSDDDLEERGILSNSSEFNIIKNAQLKLKDKDCLSELKKIPLYYLSINGLSVLEALPFIRRWIVRFVGINKNDLDPRGFLVYDYIKLAHANELSGGLQEYQALGLNAGALHDFCQQYWIPCLTFGQVNREIDRGLRCIAGSKRLTELVDSVSILAKKTHEELAIDPEGNRLISVEAARDGVDTGGNYISYDFDGNMGYFNELGLTDFEGLQREAENQIA